MRSLVLKCLFFMLAATGFAQPLTASTSSLETALPKSKTKHFKHNVQLQLFDYLGVPVPGTEFWITVDIVKSCEEVTVYLPNINFQVGQTSSLDPNGPLPAFGYIYTTAGFLPEDCRPASLLPPSIVAASNNATSLPLSFSDSFLPPFPTGYIVQVTNAGEIQIQGAGVFGNLLLTGPQIVLPCSITYIAQKIDRICSNFEISQGFTNVTQFTGPTPHGTPAGDNIRDSHINDSFEDVVVWAWTDNHNVDQSANILNTFVAVGHVGKNGELKVGEPIQLTNLPPNTISWDTSVAINRTDKKNIVVTYNMIPYDFETTFFDGNIIGPDTRDCRAVSFDGGKTWGGVYDGVTTLPFNGPLNYQPPGGQGSGDYPGVAADQYGNFWLCSTNSSDGDVIDSPPYGNAVNQPYLLISTDKGVTWSLAYNLPPVVNPQPPSGDGGTDGDGYDYPHICFGGDGNSPSQYGVWLYTDYIVSENILGDLYASVSFVPINGFGSYGSGSTTFLNTIPNVIAVPTVIASMDGRFWAMGIPNDNPTHLTAPIVSLFKSPGPLDSNYSGAWGLGMCNLLAELNIPGLGVESLPLFGFFPSVRGLVYDDARQALYCLFSSQSPDLSQNMKLYFAFSRNNGSTWSKAYEISSTSSGNRGFSSMTLDPSSGNLYFGWYDGRHGGDTGNLRYFGAVISSKKLNNLLKGTPVSNPQYSIPGMGSPEPIDAP